MERQNGVSKMISYFVNCSKALFSRLLERNRLLRCFQYPSQSLSSKLHPLLSDPQDADMNGVIRKAYLMSFQRFQPSSLDLQTAAKNDQIVTHSLLHSYLRSGLHERQRVLSNALL